MTAANCLKFQEITDTSNTTSSYIKFTKDGDQYFTMDGCWSYVGKQGGEQVKIFQYKLSFNILIFKVINLEPGCMTEGTVTHEIFHALGFEHEQSR